MPRLEELQEKQVALVGGPVCDLNSPDDDDDAVDDDDNDTARKWA